MTTFAATIGSPASVKLYVFLKKCFLGHSITTVESFALFLVCLTERHNVGQDRGYIFDILSGFIGQLPEKTTHSEHKSSDNCVFFHYQSSKK